jgi:hypothetical protein
MVNGTDKRVSAVKPVFGRCLEFTLADGQVITVKVLGDKAQAKAAQGALLKALGQ